MSGSSMKPQSGLDGSEGRRRTNSNINLDTKLRDAFQFTEGGVGGLREEAFRSAAGILASQPVVVKDDELVGLIHASDEGEFSKIDKWLDRRLREIKKHWKRVLFVPHSRPNIKAQRRYSDAAELRAQKGLSWAQPARQLDPENFKRNSRAAIDRIRKGIKSLEHIKESTAEELDLFKVALFFGPAQLSSPALSPPDPNWPEKKLEEVTHTYFYLGQRMGWTVRQMLDHTLDLYLVVAEMVQPGSGIRTLINEALPIYLGEALGQMTPSEVEQILGPPEVREALGDSLVLRYKGTSIEFKNGRIHHVHKTGKKPTSLPATE